MSESNEANIMKHINLVGLPIKDRVTRFEGVVTSISFDLYGCVQAIVTPTVDDKGQKGDQHWFDVTRLEIIGERVMPVPNFVEGYVAEGKKGAAEKPAF